MACALGRLAAQLVVIEGISYVGVFTDRAMVDGFDMIVFFGTLLLLNSSESYASVKFGSIKKLAAILLLSYYATLHYYRTVCPVTIS